MTLVKPNIGELYCSDLLMYDVTMVMEVSCMATFIFIKVEKCKMKRILSKTA